jgi:hypothetical protein
LSINIIYNITNTICITVREGLDGDDYNSEVLDGDIYNTEVLDGDNYYSEVLDVNKYKRGGD